MKLSILSVWLCLLLLAPRPSTGNRDFSPDDASANSVPFKLSNIDNTRDGGIDNAETSNRKLAQARRITGNAAGKFLAMPEASRDANRVIGVDGWTQLHEETKNGNITYVTSLINTGSKPNYKEAKDGRTALHVAIIHGHSEIVEILLQNEASVDALDNFRSTPILYAAMYGCTKCAEILLEYKANINAPDLSNSAPLHYAVQYQATEIVKMLLEHDANVNPLDGYHKAPLHYAASRGYTNIVKMLLEHHANVEAKDNEGKTPLHYATVWGDTEIIKMLLEHHANVEAKTKEGWTPLHLAAKNAEVASAEVLVDNGASKLAKDDKGHTPYDVICDDSERICFALKLRPPLKSLLKPTEKK